MKLPADQQDKPNVVPIEVTDVEQWLTIPSRRTATSCAGATELMAGLTEVLCYGTAVVVEAETAGG